MARSFKPTRSRSKKRGPAHVAVNFAKFAGYSSEKRSGCRTARGSGFCDGGHSGFRCRCAALQQTGVRRSIAGRRESRRSLPPISKSYRMLSLPRRIVSAAGRFGSGLRHNPCGYSAVDSLFYQQTRQNDSTMDRSSPARSLDNGAFPGQASVCWRGSAQCDCGNRTDTVADPWLLFPTRPHLGDSKETVRC